MKTPSASSFPHRPEAAPGPPIAHVSERIQVWTLVTPFPAYDVTRDTAAAVECHQRKCKVRLRDAAGPLPRLSCPCGAMKTPSASSFPHRHGAEPGPPTAQVSARIQVWTLVTLLSAAVVTDVTKLPIRCHQSTMPSCRAGPRTTTPTTTTWNKAQMRFSSIIRTRLSPSPARRRPVVSWTRRTLYASVTTSLRRCQPCHDVHDSLSPDTKVRRQSGGLRPGHGSHPAAGDHFPLGVEVDAVFAVGVQIPVE